MNRNPTSTWSPMVSGPEDDFTTFLDLGDLQLPFSTFEGSPLNGNESHQDAAGSIDSPIQNAAGVLELEEEHIQQQMEHSVMDSHHSIPDMNTTHGSTESLLDMNMQAELFRQHQQRQIRGQRYHGHNTVPPTPNSIEMHGGHPCYYRPVDAQAQAHAQAIYDRYTWNQKDQMVFTPLVSPAVTPLDTQFRMPEYTVPGECFSPLTSPALEAQNHAAQRSIYGAVRSSDTSDTTSPIEMNIDFGTNSMTAQTPPVRKLKKRTMSTASKNPSRSVMQSPAMKPQSRKRQPSSTIIPAKEISGIIEDARKSKQNGHLPQSNGGNKLHIPYSQDSSEAESVSPEPLSEALMPPPATPRPNSAGRSPSLVGKQAGSQSAPMLAMSNEPATPASLMKIRKEAGKGAKGQHRPSSLKEQASLAESDMEQIMEEITLLEPVTPGTKPKLVPFDIPEANDDQATPTLSARKTSVYLPSSAPPAVSRSIFPSPQLSGMALPNGSVSSKRVETKASGRAGKKRNTNTSVHVSPALRPRISPSIKPLLPEGAMLNAETSALLLASKSNYQNILEGTHLPGVSYPEALSTNLTSKRTSHKIAEQGRRNRINNALQEIASLLPCPMPNGNGANGREGSGSGGDSGTVGSNLLTGTAAQQSNSKASTVEMAIEYIRSLQTELKEVKGKLEVAEKIIGKGVVQT